MHTQNQEQVMELVLYKLCTTQVFRVLEPMIDMNDMTMLYLHPVALEID